VDCDQDGDLDVLSGMATSPSSSEMKTERSVTSNGRRSRACSGEGGPATPFQGIGVGEYAKPSAVNGDQDDDLDALVGATQLLLADGVPPLVPVAQGRYSAVGGVATQLLTIGVASLPCGSAQLVSPSGDTRLWCAMVPLSSCCPVVLLSSGAQRWLLWCYSAPAAQWCYSALVAQWC
jgi:hypothetical protein